MESIDCVVENMGFVLREKSDFFLKSSSCPFSYKRAPKPLLGHGFCSIDIKTAQIKSGKNTKCHQRFGYLEK